MNTNTRPRGGAVLPPVPANRGGVVLATRPAGGPVDIGAGVRARQQIGAVSFAMPVGHVILPIPGGMSMPSLAAVSPEKVRLSIPFGDETLMVTYRPGKMTPSLLQRIQTAERDGSISDGLLVPLSELLASWDLTDNGGEPIPTTPEALGDLPFTILRVVLERIATSMSATARAGAGR
jgi:hypothetical protein